MTWSIRRWRWRRGDRLERLVDAAIAASPGLVRGYTFTARDLRTDVRFALLGVLPMMSGRGARRIAVTDGCVEDTPPPRLPRDGRRPDLACLADEPGSRFAAAALQAAVQRPGRAMNPIVIYGAREARRWTLLDACRREVEERGRQAAVIDARDLKRVVVAASSDDVFRRRLRQLAAADVLLVDGLDELAEFPASAQDVLDALTATMAVGQQVVVTAASTRFALLRAWAQVHARSLVTDVGVADVS